MVVDRIGRAYVSTLPPPAIGLGHGDATSRPGVPIFMVEPTGAVQVVAEDVRIPNAMVITPDGATIIIAETLANRLLAYDIRSDGTLTNSRVFAELGERKPDGICLDADGNVWVGCFDTSEFVLVAEGGNVIRTIATPGRWAVACALGGSAGTTLFGLTARVSLADYFAGRGEGTIMAYRVEVPAA
jgi:sugar lactone lactonase YvrE